MYAHRSLLAPLVKPFTDAMTGRYGTSTHRRFDSTLDDLLTIAHDDPPARADCKETYLNTRDIVLDKGPDTYTQRIATGLAALTRYAHIDAIGLCCELVSQTADNHDQFFTPPAVADGLTHLTGLTALWKPPAADPTDAQGTTSLDMFTSEIESPGTIEDTEPPYIGFDPSCGSGRMLTALSRQLANTPDGPAAFIGWDISPTCVRMTAAHLLLQDLRGWVILGDPLENRIETIHAIDPFGDGRYECHDPATDGFPALDPELSWSEALNKEINDSTDAINTDRSIATILSDSRSSETAFQQESTAALNFAFAENISYCIGNPPFDKYTIDTEQVHRFDAARRDPSDANSSPTTSEPAPWLFLELALDVTNPAGAIGFIIPESLQANPSEQAERRWLIDHRAFLAGSYSLPQNTFQPATNTKTGMLTLRPKEGAYRGISLNHEVFMAAATTVGEEGPDWDVDTLVDDTGDTVSVDTNSLPQLYHPLRWIDQTPVPVPDCELPAIVNKYRNTVQDIQDSA